VRVGKQQVVWGEAVGTFYTDMVNPKDLREFLLPSFDLIRVPQWGVDAEYVRENFHAEVVWLPDLEFNRYGVTGSEFAFPYPVPENTAFSAQDPKEPGENLRNSDIGGRVSYLLNGWDLSVMYLYAWDRAPVLARRIEPSGEYVFTPRYERMHSYGATFSKEAGEAVWRGEMVYNHKAHFSIFDAADSDGIVDKDVLEYLLSFDYTLFGSLETNFQLMQRYLFDYDSRLANEHRVRNSFSVWFKKSFMDGDLDAELLVLSSLMEEDFMWRPSLTYKFAPDWQWKVGLDAFSGVKDGIFGKFRTKSRIYSELNYYF
jgi:hypothetical protein